MNAGLLLGVLLTLAAAEAEAPPSVALLEYLGNFEDADGNWIDPLSLDEEAAESELEPAVPAVTEENEDEDEEPAGDPADAAPGSAGAR